MMPPMGAGAPGAASGGEPSDASGLLSGDATPFTSTPTPDEVGSSTGAGSGGGLGLTGDDLPSDGENLLGTPPGATAEPAGGLPMMPPMGAGAPGAASGGEPSDASGLLSGDATPFTSTPTPDEWVRPPAQAAAVDWA